MAGMNQEQTLWLVLPAKKLFFGRCISSFSANSLWCNLQMSTFIPQGVQSISTHKCSITVSLLYLNQLFHVFHKLVDFFFLRVLPPHGSMHQLWRVVIGMVSTYPRSVATDVLQLLNTASALHFLKYIEKASVLFGLISLLSIASHLSYNTTRFAVFTVGCRMYKSFVVPISPYISKHSVCKISGKF